VTHVSLNTNSFAAALCRYAKAQLIASHRPAFTSTFIASTGSLASQEAQDSAISNIQFRKDCGY